MSAIENGEMFDSITLPYMESRSEKIEDKMLIQDDSRLLSDLENSADELTQVLFTYINNYVSNKNKSRKKLDSMILCRQSSCDTVSF